jgi:hypothetical protein
MRGRAIAKTANRRLLIAVAQVQFQVSTYGIYGGRSNFGEGFLRAFQFHDTLCGDAHAQVQRLVSVAKLRPCLRCSPSNSSILL